MDTLKYYWTRFLPSYPKVLLYMLQDTEYRFVRYIEWYDRTTDFRRVIKRRQLTMTKRVRLLLLGIYGLGFTMLLIMVASVALALKTGFYWWLIATVCLLLVLPVVLAYGVLVPLVLGRLIVQKRQENALIGRARAIIANHPGVHISIAGSYGKTTAKELLKVVLSEGKKTAATPGNMNTPVGISRFARDLEGDEEVIIFELGEEKPGDVDLLSELTKPSIGIITGINEAHLVSFKTLERTVDTVFEIADYVPEESLYQNHESHLVVSANRPGVAFDRKQVGGWKLSQLSTGIEGTSFVMKKDKKTVAAHTQLLGLHTVGVSAAVVAIADELGLTTEQIERGLNKVVPFEHRMEPRKLHGAWLLDDTYNGNSEGVQAGLELLKSVPATRRIYVTPGLVEQGSETRSVHEMIGEKIASSHVDIAVLMNNSVTDFIKNGLERGNFKGLLLEIDNPLDFYTNLDQFVAAGDVVLMQNDWTDNYQ